MSNQNPTGKRLSLIPPDVQQLWGPSPVLASENHEAYQRLALGIAESVKPNDVLDWLMVKDVVDLSWEIRRLRRFKAKSIEILPNHLSSEDIDRLRLRAGGEVKLGAILEDAVVEELFDTLQQYAAIDALLASAELRRAAALREIERWRSHRRKGSDEVIDGEIIDSFPATPANSQKAEGRAIPEITPKARRERPVAALPWPKPKKQSNPPSAPPLRRTSR
jgi:hypothetical protein